MGFEINIIHVDDDPDFLDLASEYLERTDVPLAIHRETDPENVLGRLKFREFDCIVSDYDMPGMDGLELLERVRDRYPRLPFILFTGKGSEEVASEAVRLDVTGYHQKSADVDTFQFLANSIEKAVDGYRARSLATYNEQQLLRYKQAVEHSDDMIAAINREGAYLFVNHAFLEFYQLDREEVEGHLIDDVHDRETVKEIEPRMQRVFKGERVSFVSYHDALGQEDRYLDVRYAPLQTPAGSINGLVSVTRDVTKLYKNDLVEEEKRPSPFN